MACVANEQAWAAALPLDFGKSSLATSIIKLEDAKLKIEVQLLGDFQISPLELSHLVVKPALFSSLQFVSIAASFVKSTALSTYKL
ncbi:hypothetical protein NL676_028307 [Syzygium grande]|nr:hypothetical protein NL676_028307 [Syzygium grande]